MTDDNRSLRARVEGGGTPEMTAWYLKSETGPLLDVLLGPASTFGWLGEENAEYSSLVRDSLRRGYRFDRDLALRQQADFGGIVSFEVEGGRDLAWKLIDATQLVSITANLGDTKTTITHPASTTHGRLTAEQREQAGISEGLIRVAVGLEDLDDIKTDLKRGLKAIQ